jgi:hypothetical protein
MRNKQYASAGMQMLLCKLHDLRSCQFYKSQHKHYFHSQIKQFSYEPYSEEITLCDTNYSHTSTNTKTKSTQFQTLLCIM